MPGYGTKSKKNMMNMSMDKAKMEAYKRAKKKVYGTKKKKKK